MYWTLRKSFGFTYHYIRLGLEACSGAGMKAGVDCGQREARYTLQPFKVGFSIHPFILFNFSIANI